MPPSPTKKAHSGRHEIRRSEYVQDMIRYHSHLLLAEKDCSRLEKLLGRLRADVSDFPIHSRPTLPKNIKLVRYGTNHFTLTDVTTLSQACMAACSTELVGRFIQHTQSYEETFKAADKVAEEMDKNITEDDLEYDTAG
ncbi:unnamed protein product [Didymodactylos carnosus]|uniref:Uncharacterized protein n=1 Tax=Didymodactylos carnosus TaxID=1234261 RepID=A0A815ZYA6_9BILA|nr:unnamed protein product [Didymodactylos carnosus]CAF1588464.1 unnamed protein product [Didymodactylos carnosus]CAF4286415.1 unnamed protein product [Didymodactylos carnosus]CAF4459445.1 unnamed protein product [Didymodactylos carnosus]